MFNVPRFVAEHGTIGLLSEHASVNAELRSLACVRDHAEQIRLVMEKEELRSVADKNRMKRKPRLCSKSLIVKIGSQNS